MTGEAACGRGASREGSAVIGAREGAKKIVGEETRFRRYHGREHNTQRMIAMSAASSAFPVIREAVASFPDRKHFQSAVKALIAAGFQASDLSVLASHEALSTAVEEPSSLVAAGLTDELKSIGPRTVAGIVLISGGPIAVALAALVGAGLGGAALKELLDQYAAHRHSNEVADALKAGGVRL